MKLIPISEFVFKYLEYFFDDENIISLNFIFNQIEIYQGTKNENFKKKYLTSQDILQKTRGIEGDSYQKKLQSTTFVLKLLEKFMEFRNILIEHDVRLHLVNGSSCEVSSSSLLVIDEDYAELFYNRFDVYAEKKVFVEEDQVQSVFDKIKKDEENIRLKSHNISPEQKYFNEHAHLNPITRLWADLNKTGAGELQNLFPKESFYSEKNGTVTNFLNEKHGIKEKETVKRYVTPHLKDVFFRKKQ